MVPEGSTALLFILKLQALISCRNTANMAASKALTLLRAFYIDTDSAAHLAKNPSGIPSPHLPSPSRHPPSSTAAPTPILRYKQN